MITLVTIKLKSLGFGRNLGKDIQSNSLPNEKFPSINFWPNRLLGFTYTQPKKKMFFALMGNPEREQTLSFAVIFSFSKKPFQYIFSHQRLNVVPNLLSIRKLPSSNYYHLTEQIIFIYTHFLIIIICILPLSYYLRLLKV